MTECERYFIADARIGSFSLSGSFAMSGSFALSGSDEPSGSSVLSDFAGLVHPPCGKCRDYDFLR